MSSQFSDSTMAGVMALTIAILTAVILWPSTLTQQQQALQDERSNTLVQLSAAPSKGMHIPPDFIISVANAKHNVMVGRQNNRTPIDCHYFSLLFCRTDEQGSGYQN